jgi:hypothetical protein
MSLTSHPLAVYNPLAEKYAGWSSYAYALNNPAKYIDPDGRKIELPKNIGERRLVRQTLRELRRSSPSARNHIKNIEKDDKIVRVVVNTNKGVQSEFRPR